MHLYFALGKALEDSGDFKGSFDNYQDGNELGALRARYDDAELPARRQKTPEDIQDRVAVARGSRRDAPREFWEKPNDGKPFHILRPLPALGLIVLSLGFYVAMDRRRR